MTDRGRMRKDGRYLIVTEYERLSGQIRPWLSFNWPLIRDSLIVLLFAALAVAYWIR